MEANEDTDPEFKVNKLTKALLTRGLLNADALSRANRTATEAGERLCSTLTRLGLVSEHDVADALSEGLGFDRIAASQFPQAFIPFPNLNLQFLRSARVLPLDDGSSGTLGLAMADVTDDEAVYAMEFVTKLPVLRKVALPTDIENAIEVLLAESDTGERTKESIEEVDILSSAKFATVDIDRLREAASDAPVIRLVNSILSRAVDERASDIHFEPKSDQLVVRFRIDGYLRVQDLSVPLRQRDAVVSRIKLIAGLDIAERRLPQDGRIAHPVRGKEIDFRVATVPTTFGESIVVRVLDRSQVQLDFDALGFDPDTISKLKAMLSQPHGLVLVTGPTGSGKTTTLYAALAYLNRPSRKLMTIEDPIEYYLDGVQQVQVQAAIGLTFERALRSFLRHNPNIVMVGEIRDQETAQVAIQVALTGHLVLSTLHTNDAVSGVTRLLDMGIEDYLIASTCCGIVAQRLVRKLCRHCRRERPISYSEGDRLSKNVTTPATIFEPYGCDNCDFTGYSGRTTILEVLPITEQLRELISRRASTAEIFRIAKANGMRTMLEAGLAKVAEGITTFDEVFAAVGIS